MGRPKGSKDKHPRVMSSATRTAAATGKKLVVSNTEDVSVCVKCGTPYNTKKGNFPKVSSPSYRGNGGYTAICSRCIIKFFNDKTEEYHGDEMKAMRRVCEWLDLYFSEAVFNMTENDPKTGSSRCMDYIRRANLRQVTGTCFDDTLGYEASIVKTEELNDSGSDAARLKKAVDIFGSGFDRDAYDFLLRSYNSYLEPLGKTVTTGHMKSARFLAMLEYRATESIKEGTNNAAQLAATFNKALKESDFDVTQKIGDANEDPFGVWIAQIEKYSPAEYVDQNPVYDDVDKMSYFDRFIVRPIRNLFSKGNYESDEELSITDADADDRDGDADAQ